MKSLLIINIVIVASVALTIQVLNMHKPKPSFGGLVFEVITTPVDTISKGDECKMLGMNVTVFQVRKATVGFADVVTNDLTLLNVPRRILKNCTPQP